ncbi:MAG: hypothetical protein A3F16_06360 [Deltaproteobacteria bacterium RIFCSPHIGHO2_12_FULL_43_9]|nr:MAG: hypothetical protein A3F16_06360 [Deltaproteobacteria bacterium RIFCSPHIGHO2_12_FULL_43_9]
MRFAFLFFSFLLLISTPTFADYEHSVSVTVDGKYYQCGNGGSPAYREVSFFKSDTCGYNLLASLQFGSNPYENEEKCRKTDKFVDVNVWGVQINSGPCINIDDDDFLSVCMRFQ